MQGATAESGFIIKSATFYRNFLAVQIVAKDWNSGTFPTTNGKERGQQKEIIGASFTSRKEGTIF